MIDVKVRSHRSAETIRRPFDRAQILAGSSSWVKCSISLVLGLRWGRWLLSQIVQSLSGTCDSILILILPVHEVLASVRLPCFVLSLVLQFLSASCTVIWHSAASKRLLRVSGDCLWVKSERVHASILRYLPRMMQVNIVLLLVRFSLMIILRMAVRRQVVLVTHRCDLLLLSCSLLFFQDPIVRLLPVWFA